MKFVTLLTVVLGLISLLHPAWSKTDETTIKGRLDVQRLESCLVVQIFLKNTKENPMQIITGSGGVDDDIEVTFICDGQKCTGARWSSFSYRRSMRPVFKSLPPKEEVLFGKFVLPVPEHNAAAESDRQPSSNSIETRLDLYTDDKRETCFQVQMQSQIAPPK